MLFVCFILPSHFAPHSQLLALYTVGILSKISILRENRYTIYINLFISPFGKAGTKAPAFPSGLLKQLAYIQYPVNQRQIDFDNSPHGR